VAEALAAAGHRVLIVDDLSSGHKENIPALCEFHQLDIRSKEAKELLVGEGVEVLVHHAAQIDVRRSIADPLHDADVNVLGTLNLLEAGRHGALKQVIFASTGGAIYGEQDVFPAGEEHATRPLSPYGVAKLAVERYLFVYHAAFGLDVACLRYANVYGPRQDPHGEAGVVAIFLERLLAGRECVINGDGLQTRDYTFVGDIVAANLAALGLEGFRIYNVGTGIETDVVTLYNHLAPAVGVDRAASHGAAKPGEQRRSVISAAKLERELGVRVAMPLAEGLKLTADWFASRSPRR